MLRFANGGLLNYQDSQINNEYSYISSLIQCQKTFLSAFYMQSPLLMVSFSFMLILSSDRWMEIVFGTEVYCHKNMLLCL